MTAPRTPEYVAIVAMGDSAKTFYRLAVAAGSAKALWDEVWAVTATAGVIQHDRAFLMDDLRATTELLAECRAVAGPVPKGTPPLRRGAVWLDPAADHSKLDAILAWARTHPGPLYTPRAYPEFPGAVEYPLADVLTTLGFAYFNNTVAYAIAFAIHLGVKRIGLYGCDFTYPDNHQAESGRACTEFMMRAAMDRGIAVTVPGDSTLIDAHVPDAERFYGYVEPPMLIADKTALVDASRADTRGGV